MQEAIRREVTVGSSVWLVRQNADDPENFALISLSHLFGSSASILPSSSAVSRWTLPLPMQIRVVHLLKVLFVPATFPLQLLLRHEKWSAHRSCGVYALRLLLLFIAAGLFFRTFRTFFSDKRVTSSLDDDERRPRDQVMSQERPGTILAPKFEVAVQNPSHSHGPGVPWPHSLGENVGRICI